MNDQNNSSKGQGIARRGFIKGLLAAGVAAPFAGSLVGGLLGADQVLAGSAEPRRGGVLRLALSAVSANDTLDPLKSATNADAVLAFAVFNTLVRSSNELQPEPGLAESWEGSEGAKRWVFKLRSGVSFHNGKAFGTEDVLYSIGRHLADEKSPIKDVVDQIASIKALDGQHVEILLKAGNADLPLLLSDYHLVIVPKGFSDFANPVGTGPFKVKSLKPGDLYVLVKNESYWVSGRPYLDGVEIIGISDAGARANALLAGEVDLIEQLDQRMVELFQSSPVAVVAPAKSGSHMSFAMMSNQAPFQDPNLRKALKHLVDREQIIKNSLKGMGQLGNDTPISPIDAFYHSELPIRAYDPDKGAYYLKQAGMDKLNVDLSTSPAAHSLAVDWALLLKQSAGKGKVDLNVVREPADSYWNDVWLKKPFYMSAWNTRPADLMLSVTCKSDAPWNEAKWQNAQFDQLLVAARAELDPVARKRMYWDMQEMVHTDGGLIIPAFLDYVDAHSTQLKGYRTHSRGTIGGWPFADELWLDA